MEAYCIIMPSQHLWYLISAWWVNEKPVLVTCLKPVIYHREMPQLILRKCSHFRPFFFFYWRCNCFST